MSILPEDLLYSAQVCNLCVVSISPEQSHILCKVWQLAPDNQLPANAVPAALHLFDEKGRLLGELASAEIDR